MNGLSVKLVPQKECHDLILNVHYAHRLPSISYAFGLFDGAELVGCCTFGSPASPSLAKGVCGEEHRGKVIELNRLVLKYNKKKRGELSCWYGTEYAPKTKGRRKLRGHSTEACGCCI